MMCSSACFRHRSLTRNRRRKINVELIDNILVHVQIIILLVDVVQIIVILIIVVVVQIIGDICNCN